MAGLGDPQYAGTTGTAYGGSGSTAFGKPAPSNRPAAGSSASSANYDGIPDGAVGNTDPPVYLDSWGGFPTGLPTAYPINSASAHFWDMGGADRKKLEEFYRRIYQDSSDTISPYQLQNLWDQAVAQASARNGALPSSYTTPWEILAKWGGGAAMPAVGGGAGAITDYTNIQTGTSTSTNLSSPSEARGLAESAARALLGRDPSKKETERFQAWLNKQQAANPTVTESSSTATSHVDTAGSAQTTTQNNDSSSTTTGGVDTQQLTAEWMRRRPDYAEYQASKYTAALINMMGEAVSVNG